MARRMRGENRGLRAIGPSNREPRLVDRSAPAKLIGGKRLPPDQQTAGRRIGRKDGSRCINESPNSRISCMNEAGSRMEKI